MSDANRRVEESRVALRAIARKYISEGGKLYARDEAAKADARAAHPGPTKGSPSPHGGDKER